jgi:hypothetical protein
MAMAGDSDMKAHEATYHSVIGLLKWGAVACFIIAFAVIWLIHPTK